MRPQAWLRRVRSGGAAGTDPREGAWPWPATGRAKVRRPSLLPKRAAFTVGRKNDEISLKGYCKGGIEPGLRRRESSRRSAPPLSGLRIQSLTKAPRTPVLQDFKGVKKSGRFTRITSSKRNSPEIIKENRTGINRFFPGHRTWADEKEHRRRGPPGLTAWAPARVLPMAGGGTRSPRDPRRVDRPLPVG